LVGGAGSRELVKVPGAAQKWMRIGATLEVASREYGGTDNGAGAPL
jgi:hypothetical protein